MLVTFYNIVLMPLFHLQSFTSTVASPPAVHRHDFPHCFCFFLIILPDVGLMQFLLFLLLVKRLYVNIGLC